MNPKQQRIAIATACGWTEHHMTHYPSIWKNPNTGQEVINDNYLPDYLNDLNAMHEAEKVLRKPMKSTDSDSIIADRMHDYAEALGYCIDATAAQRAEAFLKTLNHTNTYNQ